MLCKYKLKADSCPTRIQNDGFTRSNMVDSLTWSRNSAFPGLDWLSKYFYCIISGLVKQITCGDHNEDWKKIDRNVKECKAKTPISSQDTSLVICLFIQNPHLACPPPLWHPFAQLTYPKRSVYHYIQLIVPSFLWSKENFVKLDLLLGGFRWWMKMVFFSQKWMLIASRSEQDRVKCDSNREFQMES